MSASEDSEDDFESAESDEEVTDESCSEKDEEEEPSVIASSTAAPAAVPILATAAVSGTPDAAKLDDYQPAISCSDSNTDGPTKPIDPETANKPSSSTEVQETHLPTTASGNSEQCDVDEAQDSKPATPLESKGETKEAAQAAVTSTEDDVVVKSAAVEEAVKSPATQPDMPPAGNSNKSSTRSISSSRGRLKPYSKPGGMGGAMKLGAVKLSQPADSSIASALADLELSKETPIPQAKLFPSPEEATTITSGKQQNPTSESSSTGGWGWFAPPKSLLSSVTSLTTQILSTVESGLNIDIPDPETLAKEDLLLDQGAEDEGGPPPRHQEEPKPAPSTGGFSQLIGGVGNLTRLVESTGSALFSTGLDTLESLGKKTIDVLQHTDPGLKKTKAVLNPSQDRLTLSQVLREAKEAKEIEKLMDSSTGPATSKRSSIPTLAELFEVHHGLVHLEALEMLSQQCQNKVAPQIRRLTAQRRSAVEEVAQLCSQSMDSSEEQDNSDDFDLDDLEQSLSAYFDRIGLEVSLKKLLEAFRKGIDSEDDGSLAENFSRSLDSLASVTAASVELMHKSAELLLMTPKNANPAVGGRLEAETYHSVTTLLTTEVVRLGNHHANRIIRAEKSGTTVGASSNYTSTDIYYEASNCSSYVQNALKLMIPILQSRFF